MQIYIQNLTKLLSKKEVLVSLKKIGIKNKPIFIKNSREIKGNDFLLINLYKPSITLSSYFLFKLFMRSLWKDNEITTNYIISYPEKEETEGLYCQKDNFIDYDRLYVFVEDILADGRNPFDVLRHELLHWFTPEKHCIKKSCLFSEYGNDKNPSFCKKHKKDYKNMLKKINISSI